MERRGEGWRRRCRKVEGGGGRPGGGLQRWGDRCSSLQQSVQEEGADGGLYYVLWVRGDA